MSPRHYLVPSVLLGILVRHSPSIAHVFVFVPCGALMPGDEAVRPAGPAPSTVFVLRTLQFSVSQVRPAALRALRRGPVRTIEERNALQQAHLIAWVLDLLCDFLRDEHLDLAPLPEGTSSISVPLVAADPTPPPLRLGAVLPDMSVLLTIEALDLVAFLAHEDRHFYRSSNSWYERRGLGGIVSVRDDGCGKHAPHLHVEGVIQTRPLDAVHAIDQVTLDDEILLLDIRYSLSGLLEDIPQCYVFFLPYYTQIHRTAFFPFSPILSQGFCTFTISSYRRDPILLLLDLYDIHLVLRYDLPCTIHIYEPLIRPLVVLGEFRSLST